MPVGDLIEGVVKELLEAGVEGICYKTGRIAVPVFSLGQIHVEPYLAAGKTKRFQKKQKSRINISPQVGTLFGGLFWLLLIVAGFGAYYWWTT